MKKTVVFLASFFVGAFCIAQQKGNEVMLKGTLKNFSNQVEVEDLSEMQYLLPPGNERIIIPDSEGNFSVHFNVEKPNYFRIGRNILYLSPGDHLELFIDKADPRSAEFKGQGSEANLYLRTTPFPKGGSFLEGGGKMQKDKQATIDTILNLAGQRQAELNRLTGVSKEFKRLENARIKADIINSLQSGLSYGPYVLKLKDDRAKQYAEEYGTLIKPVVKKYSKNFVDPSLMKLVVYRDIAADLIEQPGRGGNKQPIKDWLTASRLIREMNNQSNKQQLSVFASKIAALQTPVYQAALRAYLNNLMAFGKGDPAVDFTAIDINGNAVQLSSLKGKVIYVDLWATWCGPCLAEMPYFEKLKEKYKGNPSVVFVSLSIDDGIEPWKKNVEMRKAGGFQWLINRNKLNAYNIVGIPRTLLIDKNFKMVDMNAPVPSSKESEKLIDALLQ